MYVRETFGGSTPPKYLMDVGPSNIWAQPSGPRYRGLGVRLGKSEEWKPQKVGGCGWSRCPRNRILSHVAKDMAYSWFSGCRHLELQGAFLGRFRWTYGGVRGPQRAR